MPKPQIISEPKPPLPKQKLKKPGLEAAMKLRPRYQAPRYRSAGKLEGEVGILRVMSDEDLRAELDRLKAENERLKSQRGRSVSLKVSEKGGVSVYGLGRFPVTLYKEQWQKLLAMTDEIKAFLKEHDAELKAKPE